MHTSKIATEGNAKRFFPLMITFFLLFLYCISCREDENLPPLKIFQVEPSTARVGDTIEIIGQGFSPGYAYNDVTFGGGARTDALPGSTTSKLLVEVPDGAQTGIINVNILDVESQDGPSIDIQIPVIASISPTEGWVGDTLVIRGENFQRNKVRNHVTMGSNDATVVSATNVELKVIIPQDARDGNISVMGFEGPEFKVKTSVIDAVVPSKGSVGDTIEIQGNGMNARLIFFNPDISVYPVQPFSTARSLKMVVPPGAIDGTLKVRNLLNGEEKDLETTQVFEVYPTIKEVSPLSGSAGTPVTIDGYNFSTVASENVVKFNGTIATVTEASERELLVTVPSGFSTGKITINVKGREATGPVFAVAEPGAPIIYTVSPRSGAVGSRVLITGVNFASETSGNTVTFSGGAKANIISASSTQLIVEVPANAQTGPITVVKDGKTGIGASFTISSTLVAFISSVEPVRAQRGATITVRGGNFNTATSGLVLTSAATPFNIVSVTPEQIVATVPATIELGNQTLYVVQGGKSSNGVPFEVTGIPVINKVNVTEGTPGTVVIISGKEFNTSESKNTVKFGDNAASIVNTGDTDPDKISVYVPDITPGIYALTVTAFGNTSNSISFTVKPKRIAVRNILFTENNPPQFSIKRRTAEPPSTTTIFSRSTSAPMNVVATDISHSKIYFVDDGSAISRMNLNKTGYESIYTSDDIGSAIFLDISLDVTGQQIFFSDNAGVLWKGNLSGTNTPEILYELGVDNIVPVGISYVPDNSSLYIISGYPGFLDPTILKGTTDGNQLDELFNKDDGLVNPLDVKVDLSAQKLFVLDNMRTILSGAADGSGSLSTMTTRTHDILGIALDMKDQFVYWMEFVDDTKVSVFRMKYDKSTIPGTDPASTIEEVYDNLANFGSSDYANGGSFPAGLVVEDDDGRSGAMRSVGSVSGMKMKSFKRKIALTPQIMKKSPAGHMTNKK
jgi:hypothetical protein